MKRRILTVKQEIQPVKGVTTEITEDEADVDAFGTTFTKETEEVYDTDVEGTEEVDDTDVEETEEVNEETEEVDEETEEVNEDTDVEETYVEDTDVEETEDKEQNVTITHPSTYIIHNNIQPIVVTETSLSWKIMHIITILVLIAILITNNDILNGIKLF